MTQRVIVERPPLALPLWLDRFPSDAVDGAAPLLHPVAPGAGASPPCVSRLVVASQACRLRQSYPQWRILTVEHRHRRLVPEPKPNVRVVPPVALDGQRRPSSFPLGHPA